MTSLALREISGLPRLHLLELIHNKSPVRQKIDKFLPQFPSNILT